MAVSPEPKLTIAALRPAREAAEAGRARVKRELLAETNGPYTTSELSYFLHSLLVNPTFDLPNFRSHPVAASFLLIDIPILNQRNMGE